MLTRIILIGALLIASFAYFLQSGATPEQRPPYIQGRNRTVLFLANRENGLSNVHVAASSALLENYPDIEVHFASFPGMSERLERVSSIARLATPAASNIIWHELQGESFYTACEAYNQSLLSVIHEPRSAGLGKFLTNAQQWISPWTIESHLQMYEEIGALIDEVDPAVVVLDTLLRPAIDITRDKNWQHAILTPNTLVDNFIVYQPHGAMFWKYPAMASGFKFPVPLVNIPENIYMNLRFVYSILNVPALGAKKEVLREKGLKDPINFARMHRDDVPWITMNTEGASIPVDVVPPNVTSAGPIILPAMPAAQQDPELAVWLKQAPTVLVNLGSSFRYTEDRAIIMVAAMIELMSKSPVQIIWKFRKEGEYSDAVLAPLHPFIDTGRLRMSRWLTVDPYSLLETGDIVSSVHHGGSNCYHETIASGVPHVVFPLWADLYSFAALVEGLNVGVWGCSETSPEWTAECVSSAILKTVDDSDAGKSMREAAKRLGGKIQSKEKGRDVAARVIASLAYKK